MLLYSTNWLQQYTNSSKNAKQILEKLAKLGLEEDGLITNNIKGPLIVGQIKKITPEKHSNGKTINWCQVNVGVKFGGEKGIVCAANNFRKEDFVVVALPNAVLVNNFKIDARKTYGHISNGMICSFSEVGINIESTGIIVLNSFSDFIGNIKVGDDAIKLLQLNNEIIGLNITPDRGYCFSIRGVARELATALNSKYIDPVAEISEKKDTNKFNINIQNKNECDKFVAITVENCNASVQSPYYLQKKILDSGMRPINLAVDITNYVMLEFGQPLHAYDKDTLFEPIIVRKAKKGESIITLDKQNRQLSENDLLITDKKRLLGIAGVMGGLETEITEKTKNILIESAHFKPTLIAKSARYHKLPSEASKRFERGVDYKIQKKAAQKVAELLVKYGGGKITDISSFDYTKKETIIDFNFSLTKKITSIEIPKEKQKKILEIIGCKVKNNKIVIPSWRDDIKIQEDLVEEIIRINGYEKIPSLMPVIQNNKYISDEIFEKKIIVEQFLAENNLTGVLTYPWVEKNIYNITSTKKPIEIENPIDQNAPYLRTSILQTLYKALILNFSRGVSPKKNEFGIFEASYLAFKDKKDKTNIHKWNAFQLFNEFRKKEKYIQNIISTVPKAELFVAGIIINTELKKIITLTNNIFRLFGSKFEMKQGDIIFQNEDQIKLQNRAKNEVYNTQNEPQNKLNKNSINQFSKNNKSFWHPNKCGTYIIGDEIVGNSGMMHPSICKDLNIPIESYSFELNLSKIYNNSNKTKYEPISIWPIAKTDFAFVVDKELPASQLLKTISENDNVEQVEIFDIYEGENIPVGKKSIAFSVELRDFNKTLNSEDINKIRNSIIEKVLTIEGKLRDF